MPLVNGKSADAPVVLIFAVAFDQYAVSLLSIWGDRSHQRSRRAMLLDWRRCTGRW
ncbi:hypothetical protein [Deinococcus hopiensis]|uniref:hypothetical protein n=1 Tax=Deinococcus hopiensis TaxID=309885 RepID=UPI00148310AE|nr:hypothetical protein [Deinococcus hopiensis]